MTRSRWLICAIALVVLASACGRSGKDAEPSSETTTTAKTEAAGTFGDLKDVCGPGDAKGATATGRDRRLDRRRDFSDPGFAGRPGLNQELFDTADVFAAVVQRPRRDQRPQDRRSTSATPRSPSTSRRSSKPAPRTSSWSAAAPSSTTPAHEDRLEVPAARHRRLRGDPEARGADLPSSRCRTRSTTLPIGDLSVTLAKKFPDVDRRTSASSPATSRPRRSSNDQKPRRRRRRSGWKIVYNDVYPPLGEPSWTPYAQAHEEQGRQGPHLGRRAGEPGQAAARRSSDIGYKLDWIRTDANHYDQKLIDDGGAAVKNNVYIRSAFSPFDEAKTRPRDRSSTSTRSTSTCRTARPRPTSASRRSRPGCCSPRRRRSAATTSPASACTTTPKKVTEWTGGGLHAQPNPGDERRHRLLRSSAGDADGFKLADDIKPNDGIFNCDPRNVYTLKGDYGKGVTLADVGKTHRRPRSRRRASSSDRRPADGETVDKFLTFTIVGLSARGDLRGDRERPRPHLHDDRHLQLRPRRGRDAGRVHVLAAALRLGLAGTGRRCSSCSSSSRRCSACCSKRVIMRGLQDTTETTKLVVSISLLRRHDRAGPADLEAGRQPPDGDLLRTGETDRPRAHDDHVPPGDHDRRRDPGRDRPAPPALPAPASASRCGPPSTTGRSPRSTAPAPTGCRCSLGDRHLARRARRHPHRPRHRPRRPGRSRCSS